MRVEVLRVGRPFLITGSWSPIGSLVGGERAWGSPTIGKKAQFFSVDSPWKPSRSCWHSSSRNQWIRFYLSAPLTLLCLESEKKGINCWDGEREESLQHFEGDAVLRDLRARPPFADSHPGFITCLLYYYLFLFLISDSHPVVISNCLPSHHSILTSKCHPCLIDIYCSWMQKYDLGINSTYLF